MKLKKSKPVHSFKEQLEIGNRGEQIIFQHFHVPLAFYPGRGFDFTTKNRPRKNVELKTDDFNLDKTENFFIERWSDIYRKKPGSLWQSKEKGVDWFVYYFVRNDRYFFFDNLPKLIERVEEIIDQYKLGLIAVKNYGYITGGYKVPRLLLKDFYVEYEFDGSKDTGKAVRVRNSNNNTGTGGRNGRKPFHPRGNGK